MADIVLTTLNARYSHTAFGLRYLLANLGPLRSAAVIREFDISQRPIDIAETLLAGNPNLQSFRADYPKLYSFIGESGLFDPQSMLFHPLYMLSFMLLQAIFLPALSISLTVAFIKGFNKFITQKFG